MGKPKEEKSVSRSIIPPDMTDKNYLVQEAFTSLRINLQFAVQKQGCKRIIMTSAKQSEGKSTCASNLSIVYSQSNSKTLLLDCDMRKPTLHKLFQCRSIPGLSDVLGGLCQLEEAVQDTKYKNLRVLFSGTIPPNPAELLGSERMGALLNKLSESYDTIIMDTPPINIVSDALALSPMVDGVILVARVDYSTHAETNKALASLEFAKAKTLGILLNDIVYKKSGRYGKYYNRYYYEYKEK